MKLSLVFRSLVACHLFQLLCLFSPASLAQTPDEPAKSALSNEMEIVEPTAPVTIDGSILFHVRGFESYPPERRAKEIHNRILDVAKNPNIAPESIHAVDKDHGSDIMAGDRRILIVFESDARKQGVTRYEFSRAAVLRIKEAINHFRADRQPEVLWRSAFLAIGATVAFFLAWYLIRWLFRRINRAFEGRYKARVQALKVGSFELVQAERVWHLATGFLRGIHILVFLIILYLYLEFVLSQFPWTRDIAHRLVDLVLNPLQAIGSGLVDYLPNLVFLIVLAFVTVYALKLIRLFFSGIDQGSLTFSGFDRDWAKPTFNLVRILVIAFALVVAYPYIPGSESDAFKGISIFLGVIFSLGSSSAVSNIIAGYTMIYRRAFKVGDRVQIGEFRGDVTAMRLLTTNLKTIKNEIVVVPNSLILNSNLVNYSTLAHHQGLILHSTVGIGYETSWRQVEAMLKLAADRTPGLLKEPPPFVLLKSLEQFSVDYEINAYCHDAHNMSRIYAELHRNILDQFNEHGVQIMTPAYEGDPEAPKVVAKSHWYKPPASPPPDGKGK